MVICLLENFYLYDAQKININVLFASQEFIEYTSSNIPVFSSINSTLLSLDSELSSLEDNLQSVNSNLSSAVEEVSKQQGPSGLNGTQVCIW